MPNKRLIELRKNHNLTQEQLGNIIGVKQSTIAYIENGTNDPRTWVKIKLARYFDVSIEWLFFDQLYDFKS